MKSGPMLALFAAGLFGASTPFAKILLGDVSPWLLAGLLYLGSALGLGIILFIKWIQGQPFPKIPREDWRWLGLATLFGGVLGPSLLMKGLSVTNASSASLLLNLEGVLTSALAWFAFKEHYDRRIVIGMIFIVAGGITLSLPENFLDVSVSLGSLFIVLACLSWGFDNNFTRKVSLSDAIALTFFKALVAGSVNTILALSINAKLPSYQTLVPSLVLGFFGYGLSIVLFVLALRHLGASRTGAYFSTAPFLGSIISLLIFPGSYSLNLLIAGVLMGIGVWLHLTEQHEHEHTHERLEHSHPHEHDEHHQHSHTGGQDLDGEHSHWHVHDITTHSHPHFPDVHHQHQHSGV